MSDAKTKATIIRLCDTDLVLSDPREDIRGYTVLDQSGQKIGEVEDLLIDSVEKKVRFLEVGAGGFLGLGERKFLIPVDALAEIDEGERTVRVDQTRDHISNSPEYDPELTEEGYFGSVYGYYGYAPYWGAGYAYPGFPFIR